MTWQYSLHSSKVNPSGADSSPALEHAFPVSVKIQCKSWRGPGQGVSLVGASFDTTCNKVAKQTH